MGGYMKYSENIEKIFLDDVREKKRTGYGAFHKTGKGVKHRMNGIKTPYDFMKTKERRKLDGEVKVSNMYETILTKKEFDLKDEQTQKNMMTRWREIYPNKKIIEEMSVGGKKINEQAFADLIHRLGCPPKKRGGKRVGSGKNSSNKAITVPNLIETPPPPLFEAINPNPVRIITKGLQLEYNGDYTADELSKIFTKLQLLTEGEDCKFNLSIMITERT
jgi:hypothetical protein